MIDIDILFYFPAESDSIHFGHHNITDDEIGFLLQNGFQSFPSICTFVDTEITIQLATYVATYFFIIFYD